MIRPGEIYWAHVEGVGSHKVIVVSREELNRGNTVLGAMVTSTRFESRSKLQSCVVLRTGEFGFTRDCTAVGESATLIDVADLDMERGVVSRLDDDRMRELIRAVGYAIQAECWPEHDDG